MTGNPPSQEGPTPAGRTPERWTRTDTLALSVLLLGAAAGLPWLVKSFFDITNDGAIYILTARSMLAGEGYSHLGQPFIMRPPGFPVLLMPVLSTFGTDFWILNLYGSVLGIATVGLLFVYLRPRLGTGVAFAAGVALWLNPPFQRLCNQVLSDVPGAALMLTCLIVERGGRGRASAGRDLLLGLLIAAASYVRSVNLLLLPAFLAARWLESRASPNRVRVPEFVRRRAGLLVAVPLLLLAPWSVRNAVNAPPAPAEQTQYYSYRVAMLHTDRADPASPLLGPDEIASRVPVRVEEVLALLGSRMYSGKRTWTHLALGMLGLAAIFATLLRRREAGEWFAVACLAALSVYFSVVSRLVLPLYVFAMAGVADTVRWAVRTGGGPRAASAVAGAVLAVLVLADFRPRAGWAFLEYRHEMHRRVATYLAAAFPRDAPILAAEGSHLSVYAERPVRSVRPMLKRRGLEGAVELFRRYRPVAVVAPIAEPKLLRYLAERFPVDQRFEALWVFRIDDPDRFTPPGP